MKTQKKTNTKTYSINSNPRKTNQSKVSHNTSTMRQVNKNIQSNISYDKEITNEFHIQKDLQTIGIYDHEWYALHGTVRSIKNECSKFNLSPVLDGFGITILIPLIIGIIKILKLNGAAGKDIIIETTIYLILFIIYLIFVFVRKVFKPKWLTSYTNFDSDIEHLDNRMLEIENRIGIEFKEKK